MANQHKIGKEDLFCNSKNLPDDYRCYGLNPDRVAGTGAHRLGP